MPVTSLSMIQFTKTVPYFVRLYISYKMVKSGTKKKKEKKKSVLSLKIIVYIYGRYKYTG